MLNIWLGCLLLIGNVAGTTDEVQKAWLFCMMELMPCINADVAKKGGLPLSQHLLLECGAPCADAFPMTTSSDEDLIYWFFHAYFEKEWKGAVARDLGKRKNPDQFTRGPTTKRAKTQGKPGSVNDYDRLLP
jgi:hypothetical protein